MQLILNIPDNKFAFFMELVSNLGFVEVGKIKSDVLTNLQIELVETSLKKAVEDPSKLIDEETALQQIDWDAC